MGKIFYFMNQDTNKNVLDFAEGTKPELPSGINVLTILTFIGCALAFISSIWSFITAEKSYRTIVEAQDKLATAPGWAKRFMGPEMVEMARKTMENRVPILILSIVGVVLCFVGAMQMRKLKKQGYILWLVGEVLPIGASIFFIGMGFFTGFALIGILFPVAFIILYTFQRKYLIY